MKNDEKQQETRLRNPLCVRWTDSDYKFVVDESWRRRTRLSEMIRQLVLNGLRKEVSIGKNNA